MMTGRRWIAQAQDLGGALHRHGRDVHQSCCLFRRFTKVTSRPIGPQVGACPRRLAASAKVAKEIIAGAARSPLLTDSEVLP